MRTTALALCALAAIAGCGATGVTPAEDIVAAAQESLQERKAGTIDFGVEASAEESDTVGFAVRGDYEFGKADLAVVDIVYEIDGGEETVETRIVSDGEAAVVVANDEVVELEAEQAEALSVSEGSAPGLPAIDLARWLKDGEVRTKGDRTEVRGDLRAAAFIADLQRIALSVAGGGGAPMSDDDAEAIDRAAKEADLVIVTEGEDHELRSLQATVEFGARVPAGLRDTLGRYAGARLSLTLTIDDVKTPLTVDLPR